MAQGVKALRKVQLGLESTSTPGTIVAATAIWRGEGTLSDDQVTVFPPEDIGNLGGSTYSYIPKLAGSITLEQDCLFEQLPYVLSAGVEDVVAGAADSSGTDKIYTYTHGTTTQKEVKTYTIEGGDNAGAEVAPGAFVTEFTLSGVGGEAIKLSSNWFTYGPTPQAFTSVALGADTSIEAIAFSNGKLYIDACDSSTAVGTTLVSNTLLGMTLKDTTGQTPVYSADGSKNYGFRKAAMPDITLDLTFEHNTATVAQKVLWRAGTARQLRLIFTGSA